MEKVLVLVGLFLVVFYEGCHGQDENARRVRFSHGNNAVLKCVLVADRTNSVNEIWTKDGKPVGTSHRIVQYIENDVAVLLIKGVLRSDEGVYRCHNNRGKATKIVVGRKSEIIVGPHSQSVSFGSRLRVTCTAIGYPTPFVRLFRDGRMVARGRGEAVASEIIAARNRTVFNCSAVNMHGVDAKSAVVTTFELGISIYADRKTKGILIALGVVIGVFVVICLLVLAVWARHRSGGYNLKKKEPIESASWHTNPHYVDMTDASSATGSIETSHPRYEIQPSELNFVQTMLKGRHMEIHHANYFPIEKDRKASLATVKVLKSKIDQRRMDDVVSVLQRLRHDNVLNLLGTCRQGSPKSLIFEACLLGDLKTYLSQKDLRRLPPADNDDVPSPYSPAVLSSQDKLHAGIQICSGMVYLARKGYLHKDLATRNCLLTEDKTVKISDIGIGSELYPADYHLCETAAGEKHNIPLAWMPPELIMDNQFDIMSCAWSFGVTLWEVFSFARCPFDQADRDEIKIKIATGQMPGCPMRCPRSVYNVMNSCWRSLPEQRPSLKQIHETLLRIQSGTRV